MSAAMTCKVMLQPKRLPPATALDVRNDPSGRRPPAGRPWFQEGPRTSHYEISVGAMTPVPLCRCAPTDLERVAFRLQRDDLVLCPKAHIPAAHARVARRRISLSSCAENPPSVGLGDREQRVERLCCRPKNGRRVRYDAPSLVECLAPMISLRYMLFLHEIRLVSFAWKVRVQHGEQLTRQDVRSRHDHRKHENALSCCSESVNPDGGVVDRMERDRAGCQRALRRQRFQTQTDREPLRRLQTSSNVRAGALSAFGGADRIQVWVCFSHRSIACHRGQQEKGF